MSSLRCRVCGGDNLRIEYSQGNRQEYRFYRCIRCRLVNHDLSGGLSQIKYAEEFVDPFDDLHRHNRGQSSTYEFLRRHLPSRSGRQRGRMMDIGCGNGRLLLLAKNDGWKVSGLELSRLIRYLERLGLRWKRYPED